MVGWSNKGSFVGHINSPTRARSNWSFQIIEQAYPTESLYGTFLRFLSTGLLLVGTVSTSAAQDDAPELHPVLGKRPPREVLNKDILDLSREEGAAWVHGAVAQMASVLASRDLDTARCIQDWYFGGGDGAVAIPYTMKELPDERAVSTIITLASRACPEL